MKLAIALGLLGLAGCTTIYATENERRWKDLDGRKVWMVTDYGTTVHGVQDCPKLAASKGQVKTCTVQKGRVVDEQGLYATGPEVRADLCATCVK
jgi:hypothetical protein